ncbi:MAG: hypothetical protein IPI30_21620 [Saprospiraceae bacterium]|nr:hypothetical protein [Candidatus Vicinibacter affinis]
MAQDFSMNLEDCLILSFQAWPSYTVSYTSPRVSGSSDGRGRSLGTVRISGIDPQYCFKDQDIPVLLNPPGGEFFN